MIAEINICRKYRKCRQIFESNQCLQRRQKKVDNLQEKLEKQAAKTMTQMDYINGEMAKHQDSSTDEEVEFLRKQLKRQQEESRILLQMSHKDVQKAEEKIFI